MIIRLSLCVISFLFIFSVFADVVRTGKVTFSAYEKDEKTGFMVICYYMMNADGSDIEKLVDRNIKDGNEIYQVQGPFSLSPDCKKVVFLINGENARNIAILNIESHKIENLTKKTINVNTPIHPRWSSDGRQIIFSDISTNNIYIIDSDGSNIKKIGNGNNPDWSPDGQEIAFADGDNIFTMRIDGSNEKKIATSPTQFLNRLRWSPDRKQILFTTYRNDGVNHVYLVDSDGNNLMEINDPIGYVCWSPDGKKIAFVKQDSGKPWNEVHIWVMNPDGSEPKRLTNNEGGESDIDWRAPVFIGVSPSSNTLKTMWGKVKSSP